MSISDIAQRLSETQTAAAINTVANTEQLIASGQALFNTLGSNLPLDGIEAPDFNSIPGASIIGALDSAGSNTVGAVAGVVGQIGLQGAAEQVGGQLVTLLETGATALQEQIADGIAQIPTDQIPALPEQQIVDGINQGAQALADGLNQIPTGEIGGAIAQGAQALSDGIAQITDAINGGGGGGGGGNPPAPPAFPTSFTEAAQAFVGAAPLEMIPTIGQQIEDAVVAGAMQLDAAIAGGGGGAPSLPELPETNLTPVLNALAAGDLPGVVTEAVTLLEKVDVQADVEELNIEADVAVPNPFATGFITVEADLDVGEILDAVIGAAQDPTTIPAVVQSQIENAIADLQALAGGAGGAPSVPMSATEGAQALVGALPLEMIPEVGQQIEDAIVAGAMQLDAAIAGAGTGGGAPSVPMSATEGAQALVGALPLEMIPEVGQQIEDAIVAGAMQLDAAIAGAGTGGGAPSIPMSATEGAQALVGALPLEMIPEVGQQIEDALVAGAMQLDSALAGAGTGGGAPSVPMSATEGAQALVGALPLEMIPEVGQQIEDALVAGAMQLDSALAGAGTGGGVPAFPTSLTEAAEAFLAAAPLEMIPEVGQQIEDAILAGAMQLDAAFAGAGAGGNPLEGGAEQLLAALESGAGSLPISADAIQQQFAGIQDQLTGLLPA